MNSTHHPILDTTKPFNGSIESFAVLVDGEYRIQYSGYLYNNGGTDLSLEKYREKVSPGAELISWADFARLVSAFVGTLITPPARISEERYNEALDCLPPCRWQQLGGVEIFHISERLYGNLVSWFVHLNHDYYTFTNYDSLTHSDLLKIINSALVESV